MPPSTATLLEHLRRLTHPPAADAVLLSRWVQERDEAAFAALVARHGPMVMGVCRRIFGDAHEAEDAFQATFLILARKAASLRRPEALACWLHGVAARLARKARATAQRRIRHSRSLAVEPADARPDPLDLLTVREMLGLIDEEIRALREVYRLPVVLCDLEGRTQEEAAALLGWTPGSLRGRLLRGRAHLKVRLARRGLTLPAGIALPLVPAALSESLASAGPVVSPQLVANVTQMAQRFSTDSAATELSGPAVELAREGLRGVTITKLKIAAAMILTLTVCVAGAGLLGRQIREASGVALAPREAEFGALTQPRSPDMKPSAEKPQARLDRFGDPLPEGAVARLGTVRFRHGQDVSCVAFSPDGTILASGGHDNTVRLWEIASGKEIRRFTAVTKEWAPYVWVQAVAFSPDGKFVAAGTGNGPAEVIIWTVADGKEWQRFSGNQRRVNCLAFAPDSKTLAAGVDEGMNNYPIRLWDAGTGKQLPQLKGQAIWINSLAFSPDGKVLASTNRDNTIRLWDPSTGQELRRLEGHTNEVYAVAFARDGKSLASGSIDQTIRLWDPATGKELRTLNRRIDLPSTLAFLPDNKTLASSGLDGVLRLWDTATGAELRQMRGHQGSVAAIAVSADGKLLASAGSDRTIRLWDAELSQAIRPTEGHQNWLWAAAISPDGEYAATGGDDGTVRLWEMSTGKEVRRLPYSALPRHARGHIDRLAFSADGKTLNAASWANGWFRWEMPAGKLLDHRGYDDVIIPLATPDGKFVVGSDGKGAIHLINAVTGEKIRQFKTPRDSVAAALSPDGKFLAANAPEDEVVIWELATGKETCRCKGYALPWSGHALAFSPDGRYLAAAIKTNSRQVPPQTGIFLWEAATGREVRQFQSNDAVIVCLAFSPDGRMLASGGNKMVRLWETTTGKERRVLAGHQGYIRSVAFSPGSTRLVSASDDTTALVWDATAPTVAGKPTATQLQAAWSDLAGEDAVKAYRAVWLLARHPKQSVALLREHLPLARMDTESRKQIERWLSELDNEEAAVRERASAELEKRVVMAEPMLHKALTGRPSLEQRKRIERVLEHLDQEKVMLGRALEVLEHAHTLESRQLLETLAAGEPDAWLTQEAKAALIRRGRNPASSEPRP